MLCVQVACLFKDHVWNCSTELEMHKYNGDGRAVPREEGGCELALLHCDSGCAEKNKAKAFSPDFFSEETLWLSSIIEKRSTGHCREQAVINVRHQAWHLKSSYIPAVYWNDHFVHDLPVEVQLAAIIILIGKPWTLLEIFHILGDVSSFFSTECKNRI